MGEHGTNLDIVEHVLDNFFVPQLLQSGAQIGNAKFSNRVVRVEAPSDKPTPFNVDDHLNGGGTEIYHSLMSVAAHLTLPVLDMTGDAGVILITDGEQHSFSVPYQIGNFKNFMTALSETLARIRQRMAMAPESRRDIRQAAELYHPHMWYLLEEE